MSSVVGSEESQPSDWFHIPVPPRYGDNAHPTIDSTEDGNNSIAVTINKHYANNDCKVGQNNMVFTIKIINLIIRLLSTILSMVMRS